MEEFPEFFLKIYPKDTLEIHFRKKKIMFLETSGKHRDDHTGAMSIGFYENLETFLIPGKISGKAPV